MSNKRSIVYTYRGMVERPSKRGYVWKEGYSATGESGGALQPWQTKAECRKDAESQGGKAVFETKEDGQ